MLGSMLGPLLFLVYVKDIPSYVHSQSSVALFADDTKLFKPIDRPGAKNDLQADLNSLQKMESRQGDEIQ